ncbi:DNA-directed RNA polymerase II subunit [Penicillium daleae]|uniref:DNA-directed RNA polymerase II subunit n=1 Tax=Penicillium daleae TaxID=63821 RepID=A0AAD6C659_9EURO|nr:DNA-directed RNA polymerase II subunit [Penicillium daleae]KAJ5449795.1 DNA-directed RNA polymerase II subunit [Penicillium daleae]
MSSYCYPSSRFDFTTASVAIARERAGSRSRPAPRSHRPPHAEDRPDPSVSKDHPRACHSPVALDRVSQYEAILLGPGENKIDVEVDTRMPSAAIFTFHKEDHTLGNMIRSRLLRTAHVTFAAYRVPHPLTPNFQLRCQTDGEITPRQAVINACQALIKDLGILSREFTKEYELRKMANAANQQQNIGE